MRASRAIGGALPWDNSAVGTGAPTPTQLRTAHRLPKSEGWHRGPVDSGCHLSPNCFECALPECIYDEKDRRKAEREAKVKAEKEARERARANRAALAEAAKERAARRKRRETSALERLAELSEGERAAMLADAPPSFRRRWELYQSNQRMARAAYRAAIEAGS